MKAAQFGIEFDQSSQDASIDRHAFPKLTPLQIEEIEKFAEHRQFAAHESLWNAGDSDVCMFVVQDGVMSIRDGRTQLEIVQHGAGSFSGDIDVINRRPVLTSGSAETDLQVLMVSGDCVRSIVGERPEIGEIILRAYLLRRNLLQQRTDVGVKVIGSRFSPDTLRIREFLARNRYPQSWDDLEITRDTQEFLRSLKVTEEETPLVILPNGQLMKSPSNSELSHALGITPILEEVLYDLVVVGAGPGGLAAAVYGASEGLNTLVIDADVPGGQAGTSSRIENYMGFPLGLTGQDLADRAVSQAEKFGARMVVSACVESMACSDPGVQTLNVDGVGQVRTRCVILACGAYYRRLKVADLDKFENRGVYYSATRIEQLLCGRESVIVVGGGNSAGQAAVFMTQQVEKVYLVLRSDDLRKHMSAYLARRIELSDKVEVVLNSEISAVKGSDHLESAVIKDITAGTEREVSAAGIFVMIGAVPRTEWLPDHIALDEKGFILTGYDLMRENRWTLKRYPFYLETSCPGVFAVGDARSGSVKRVASAVGEGSMSVAFVHQFLSL